MIVDKLIKIVKDNSLISDPSDVEFLFLDYVISDKLSIHVTGHPRKGKVSPEQVKTINNFIPKSEKDGLKQLINFANKAKEIGAKVTFKSPANQGAIPYRQGINMLTQGSK